MFEKISAVLADVDRTRLAADIAKYGKYERMRQIWSKDGYTDDKIMPYLMKLKPTSKNILTDIDKYHDAIVKEGVRAGIQAKKAYVKFLDSFTKIEGLAKIFDVASDIKNSFNPDINKNLARAALFEKRSLMQEVVQEIDNYVTSSNNDSLLKVLVKAIQSIADDIEKFISEFYQEKALKVFNSYKSVYTAVFASKENLSKGMLASSLRLDASDDGESLRAAEACSVLNMLQGLAKDAGKKTEMKRCEDLFKKISKSKT